MMIPKRRLLTLIFACLCVKKSFLIKTLKFIRYIEVYSSCNINKVPVNFSLPLDMKPGTSYPNKWYRNFGSFR